MFDIDEIDFTSESIDELVMPAIERNAHFSFGDMGPADAGHGFDTGSISQCFRADPIDGWKLCHW